MRKTIRSFGRLLCLAVAGGSIGAIGFACEGEDAGTSSGTRSTGATTSTTTTSAGGSSASTTASGAGVGGSADTTGSSTSTSGSSGGTGGSGTSGSGAGGSATSGTGAGGSATSGTGAGGSGAGGSGSGVGGKGGATGAGGSTGASGAGGSTGAGGKAGAGGSGGTAIVDGGVGRFSFFVTSLAAVRRLSGSQDGFGGDLRFGKADGLSGADEICRQIAETSMPGAGQKQWRAFLSVTKGPDGVTPVNAIDRVGEGPWYDRKGRLLAMNRADLLQVRPRGADPAIINDFPNEDGVPNHAPEGTMQVDNHDTLTGTNTTGTLHSPDWSFTCHDWTSKVGADGKPRVGHSWPRMGSGENWMSALNEGGCAPGVNLVEMGGPTAPTVGSGGGYGGFYCFALTP